MAHTVDKIVLKTQNLVWVFPENLGDILSERESIASEMHDLLEEATDSWGVTVER